MSMSINSGAAGAQASGALGRGGAGLAFAPTLPKAVGMIDQNIPAFVMNTSLGTFPKLLLNGADQAGNLASLALTKVPAGINIAPPSLKAATSILRMDGVATAAMKSGKQGVGLAAAVIRAVGKVASLGLA